MRPERIELKIDGRGYTAEAKERVYCLALLIAYMIFLAICGVVAFHGGR